MALGYFAAITVNKYTKEKLILPLIWFISLVPDLDFFFFNIIQHRGPTHSIILAAAIFLPFFLKYKRGLPYFAALLTHSIIGDYFTNPVQLLWPISNWFRPPYSFRLTGLFETTVEVILFLIMIYHLYKTRSK